MLLKHINPLDSCELKFSGNAGVFEGYASVFGNVDSYGDTILKGAYTDYIMSGKRPLMLFGHNPNRVIGKWIEVEQDDKGLRVVGEFTPGHTDAQDAYASLKHGAVDGISIGYRIPEGGAEKKEGGGRLLKTIDLVEMSIVSMPADDFARVGMVKSEIETIQSLKDAEQFLRDSGAFSKSMATMFVSHLKTMLRSESAKEEEEKQAYEAILHKLNSFKVGS